MSLQEYSCIYLFFKKLLKYETLLTKHDLSIFFLKVCLLQKLLFVISTRSTQLQVKRLKSTKHSICKKAPNKRTFQSISRMPPSCGGKPAHPFSPVMVDHPVYSPAKDLCPRKTYVRFCGHNEVCFIALYTRTSTAYCWRVTKLAQESFIGTVSFSCEVWIFS